MQPIKQTDRGVLIRAKVKASQTAFAISDKGPYAEVRVRAEPLQNKVNREIMKELGRLFDRPVMIVKGLTSIDKLILVQDAKIEDVKKRLQQNL